MSLSFFDISGPHIGIALVPYYRQILPIFYIMGAISINETSSNKMELMQKQRMLDQIGKTLHLLEKHGGPDAFINIKYIIPTYESYFL